MLYKENYRKTGRRCEGSGMKLNVVKTKIIRFNNTNKISIMSNERKMQVEKFSNLGSILTKVKAKIKLKQELL